MEKTVTLLKSEYDRMEKICEEKALEESINVDKNISVTFAVYDIRSYNEFKTTDIEAFISTPKSELIDINKLQSSINDSLKSIKDTILEGYNNVNRELQSIKSKWWYNILVKNH